VKRQCAGGKGPAISLETGLRPSVIGRGCVGKLRKFFIKIYSSVYVATFAGHDHFQSLWS